MTDKTMKQLVEYFEGLKESSNNDLNSLVNELVVEIKKNKSQMSKFISKMDGGGAKWWIDNSYRFQPVVRKDGGIEVSVRINGDFGYPVGEDDGEIVNIIGYDLDFIIYVDDGIRVELSGTSGMRGVKDIDIVHEYKGKKFDPRRDLLGLISGSIDEFDRKIQDMKEYDTGDEESRVMGPGGFAKWSNPSLFRK